MVTAMPAATSATAAVTRTTSWSLRKGRVDVVGGFDEPGVGLGDLLLVADVAESVEEVGGAHRFGDRRLGDVAPIGGELALVLVEHEREILRLECRHVDRRER